MKLTKKKEHEDFWQSIKIGCIAGAAEASINHPLYILKMRQQAADHSFRLYHGLLPNIATMVLLTGIRLTLSTALTKKLNQETQLTQESKKIIASFIGGGFSSLIGSPMEFIRYRQLKAKRTFYETSINLYRQNQAKIFFTGFVGTSIRDSIYTIGFYSLAPIIKKSLQQTENNSLYLSIFSGALAGVIAGIVSQPFDTLKVEQQKPSHESISLKSSFNKITEHGYKALFKGSFWRIMRVVSGVTIISTIYEQYDNNLSQKTNSIGGLK